MCASKTILKNTIKIFNCYKIYSEGLLKISMPKTNSKFASKIIHTKLETI
jgi:hypothetical protein